MSDIVFKELSFKIVGSCMTVHNELGPGFMEAVYEEALRLEFRSRGIEFRNQVKLGLYYKGSKMKKFYKADFLIEDSIILELKSISMILPVHISQLVNYLKFTGKRLGIIVNFGRGKLEYKRVLNPNAH